MKQISRELLPEVIQLRESPTGRAYLHNMTAGAWLPLMQSVISGLVAGVAVLAVGLAGRWRSPWADAGIVAALVVGLSWLVMARHWLSLTALERLTGLDLNHDGRVGEPEEQETQPTREPDFVRVQVDHVTAAGHVGESQIFNLPATREQLAALAAGVLRDGLTFSERVWTGQGKPFSVDGWRSLRSEFIKRGLLALVSAKDPRQGYVLTLAGRHVLESFLEEPA
jgi:hypothetical protein